MTGLRRAAYPGSFNPATNAHLAVADAVRRQRDVGQVTLVVSHRALAKEEVVHPTMVHRHQVLEALADRVPWLEVQITERQLLADISEGFDVLVMGADKWHQINELRWYDNDPTERDAALARLPELAIAPRPPFETPDEYELHLDDAYAEVSSTAARSGALELMVPEARRFALRTGAWIEPQRYDAWLAASPSSRPR